VCCRGRNSTGSHLGSLQSSTHRTICPVSYR
jgi:hypothetical protein